MALKIFPFSTAVLLVCLSLVAQAANNWKFSQEVDDMTDEVKCRLDGPTQKILMSFQGDALYFISGSPLTFDRIHLITIRVDKNPAQKIRLNVITPQVVSIDNNGELNYPVRLIVPGQLDDLVREFSSGASFKLRVPSLNSIVEDSGSLSGFSAAYEQFKQCNSRQES